MIVEAQRGRRSTARSRDHQDRGEIESLFHEPPLRLPLHGVAGGPGTLGDEEDFPFVAEHQLVDAANGARLERLERRPEIRRLLDRLPDRVASAPELRGVRTSRLDLPRTGSALASASLDRLVLGIPARDGRRADRRDAIRTA